MSGTERAEEVAEEPLGGPAPVAHLRALVERTRPVSTAEQRILPVLPAIEDLLPDRGLRRGSLVRVDGATGATSLALAVAAGPTRAGSWVACVGVSGTGWAAAAEAGIDLTHLVVVQSPRESWSDVVAALVDGFDVVLCGPDHVPPANEVRRLRARARERGAVLVALTTGDGTGPRRGVWPSVDVSMSVADPRWRGLGQGWGHLRRRVVTVEVSGRGAVAAGRRVDLFLPGPGGGPERAPQREAPVSSIDPVSASAGGDRRVG